MCSATEGKDRRQRAIDQLVKIASEQGEADHYAGKRSCVRFADGVLLDITTEPKGPAEWRTVYMHNVSLGGCAFWSKRALSHKTAVWVRQVVESGQAPWLAAEVSHCTVGIRGFLIGVSFGQAAPIA